jgi:hypothetical protein
MAEAQAAAGGGDVIDGEEEEEEEEAGLAVLTTVQFAAQVGQS